MKPIAIIDRGRGPELAHGRITVFDVLHYMQAGHDADYIAAVLGVSTADILALQQYIEDHKQEVMAMNQRILERIARGNPPEVEAKLQASPAHARLQARWAEVQAKRARETNGEGDPGRQ